MKKVCILVCLLMILALIVGCAKADSQIKETELNEKEEEIKSCEKKNKKLEEKNNAYEIRNRTLEGGVDSCKKFIEEAVKYIDDDKMSELAKNEWSYDIKVDEKPITPDDKDIEINKGEFEIIFSAKQSILSSIISEINKKGRVSGEYQDHLKIVGLEPMYIGGTDGTIITSFRYEFKDVPENTNFKLQLSNELRERLGLSNTVINIHVK